MDRSRQLFREILIFSEMFVPLYDWKYQKTSLNYFAFFFFQTGLTPLMEAASGGYVDVGRVLIDRGADVNAQPVPSSRDTALTIAADKGHYKFVELLVVIGAQIDVRNKKGCTPLWLSANGMFSFRYVLFLLILFFLHSKF